MKPISRSAIFVCLALLLDACGGGGVTNVIPGSGNGTGSSPQGASVRFVFTIPARSSSSVLRPHYIAPSTLSIKVSLLTVNGGAPPAGTTPLTINVTSTTQGCTTTAGVTTCTESYGIPVALDQIEIQTFDASNAGGNLLSQQISTITPTAGIVNNANFTLDANPSTITLTPPGTGVTGSVGAGFTVNGTSGLVFSVSIADKHAAPIPVTAAGAPVLSASSSNISAATVTTNSAAGTMTITPTVAGGSSTITLKANPANASDGLSASQIQFTVQSEPSLIAVGSSNATTGHVDLLTLGASSFTSFGVIPSSALGTFSPAALGLDTNNKLYMFDNNSNVILEFPFSELSQTSGQTFTTITNGITSGSATPPTFALAPDGTMVVGNTASASTLNQLVEYAPGATAPTLTRSLAAPPAPFVTYRAGQTAVLTNASAVPFAYAVSLSSDDGDATGANALTPGPGKIAIITTNPGAISGATSTTCNISCFELDLTNEAGGAIGNMDQVPGLVWNNHNQELVFFDNMAGTVSAYHFNGSSFGAPTLIESFVNADTTFVVASYAVSRDGHLAVESADTSGNTIVKIFDSSHSTVATWTFPFIPATGAGFVVFGIAFTPNNTVIITGGYNNPPNQVFAYSLSGGNLGTVTNPTALATFTTTDGVASVGSSGQSVHRRQPFTARRRPFSHRIP